MWRSDLNRRRECLTRSLFHDVSLLSPVHEEEVYSDSPRRRYPATRYALLPPARPYSPLPPLIIEVEKRVNKHDHPEEFYVTLERRMKRLYRRLFLEGGNVSSAMSTDDDEDVNANDDNRSEERSRGNIDIDEEIDKGSDNNGSTETEVISDRRLKRRSTLDNDSSDSEEDVKSKKSKSNDSSSTDVLPRSSSGEEFDDEAMVSSIAEEEVFEMEEENIEEANYAKVQSFGEEEIIDESYNEKRDDVETTSGSLDHIEVTFQADVHRAYSEMDDGGGDSVNQSVQGPEAANEDVESLDNNEGSTAPDRGDDMTRHGMQPDDVPDAEAAGEEIGESLERDEVSGNNAMPAPDRGDKSTTPFIQPDNIPDPEPAGEETSELLENSRVPDNQLLAPAPGREVELMRTPLMRPSIGSLPEHPGDSSHEEPLIDLEFLNRTEDEVGDDDAIEERDVGTQTSFEEATPEDWGNILVGQPEVFYLCHWKCS